MVAVIAIVAIIAIIAVVAVVVVVAVPLAVVAVKAIVVAAAAVAVVVVVVAVPIPTAGTSAPYAPSWRIRRTPAQWPMINDVPPKQKIRLIGTYHDLTLGPYWDGYSQTHNGKGPPVNIIAQGAKPIHFDATNTGKTTAAHAVGLFLRREMYKKIDGPWVNAFISKKDENFMKEVQENYLLLRSISIHWVVYICNCNHRSNHSFCHWLHSGKQVHLDLIQSFWYRVVRISIDYVHAFFQS